MQIPVGVACIVLLCGAMLGAVIYRTYICYNYLLHKKAKPEKPKRIFVLETAKSMKSKQYICPWCTHALEIKLFPEYFADGDTVEFRYFGELVENQSICPKCGHKIEWPNIYDRYVFFVNGKDNYEKICEHLSDKNFDWEEWLKQEQLIEEEKQ